MKCGISLGLFLASALTGAFSDAPKAARPAISNQTRLELIRLMNAEYAWVKVPIPRSEKGIKILPDGKISPGGRDLQMDVAKWGPLARPGERVQVTSIDIRNRSVLLELNGGYTKKAKWYQRIQVSANGGSSNVAPGPDNTRARGTTVTVEFKKQVPEMTMVELKQILSPLLDFTVKSAAQAYTESLPKNVQDAIKDHRVLVGMNKEMVTYAKGRPPQRVREKDESGQPYEEWIYGAPPADTEFVRFNGEEVTQLKIMKIGGERVVKTEREVKLQEPTVAKEEEPPPVPSRAPTLRRPGEAAPDPKDAGPGGKVVVPNPTQTPSPSGGPDGPRL